MGSTEEHDRAAAEVAATLPSIVLDGLVRRALEQARGYLLAQRRPEGCWSYEAAGSGALEADYILLRGWLGEHDLETSRLCGEHLLATQRHDGGWSTELGGASCLDATVKAYFALKLLGHAPSSEPLRRAREAIAELGGIGRVDEVTRYWLALWGQWDYERCEPAPIELLFGPQAFPWHIQRWGAAARPLVVALGIVGAHRPVRPAPAGRGVAELWDDAARSTKSAETTRRRECDRSGTRIEKEPLALSPGPSGWDLAWRNVVRLGCFAWRRRALILATEWMVERFASTDGLGANFAGLAWSWLALTCRGFDRSSPEWRYCEEQLESLLVREAGVCRVRPRRTTVRDTADALDALQAGGVSTDEPRIRSGIDWLSRKEVTRRGDWARHADVAPSGWYRERYNEYYPDVETTTRALTALGRRFGRAGEGSASWSLTSGGDEVSLSGESIGRLGGVAQEHEEALAVLSYGRFSDVRSARRFAAGWDRTAKTFARGRAWLLAMQRDDGGWGRYSRVGASGMVARSAFRAALEVADEGDPGLTGDVLRLLGEYDESGGAEVAQRAVEFLRRRQRGDGVWRDASGRDSVHVTARALGGLNAIGATLSAPEVKRGVTWLLDRQHADGSWSELAADDVATTSIVLLGLSGVLGRDHASLRRAVAWLVARQTDEGSWNARSSEGAAPSATTLALRALGDWANSH